MSTTQAGGQRGAVGGKPTCYLIKSTHAQRYCQRKRKKDEKKEKRKFDFNVALQLDWYRLSRPVTVYLFIKVMIFSFCRAPAVIKSHVMLTVTEHSFVPAAGLQVMHYL